MNRTLIGSECPKVALHIVGPHYHSKLIVVAHVLEIQSEYKRPNVWWRFWQRVLLGFKWEQLD